PPIDASALPQVPAAYKESAPSPLGEGRGEGPVRMKVVAPAQPANGAWWTVFQDQSLDDLIRRADASNTSVKIAAARWVQARAQLLQANADRAPQLGVGAGVQRGDGLTVTNLPPGNPQTFYTAGVNVSWDADLFGRLRRAA